MAWARIDDNMPDHPKVVEVGAAAELVAYRAICYANRYLTDGFIPAGALSTLTARLEWLLPDPPEMLGDRMAERLIAVGLWHKRRGGFLIHDYLKYNFSRTDALQKRAQNAARMKSFRERNAARNALPDGSPTPSSTRTRSTRTTSFKNPSDSFPELATRGTPGSNGAGASDPASELLEFLNRKTGHRYRPVKTTLDMIRARLASGASADQVRWVIAAKCREWRDDPDRAKYLRPETLFRASKFESYLGQLPNLGPHEEV